VRTPEDGLALAVKGSSDLAFAAKHKRSLKFHLYPLESKGACAVGIITAVYDRTNAPIVIQTVCIDEVMRQIICEIAERETIGIYFFDLHNSELAGGRWGLVRTSDVSDMFQTCNSNLKREEALEFYVALKARFSDPKDDGLVIEATLIEESTPQDVSVLHVTNDSIRSRRGEGHGIYQSNILGDMAPGEAHEAQIARLLTRVYPHSDIVVNPEISKGKEFCDVLAVGRVEAVAIHAKSTIQDAKRFDEDLARRVARLDKHFRKAIAQAKGAERAFYSLRKNVTFENESLPLTPETKLLIHVIVLYDKSPNLLTEWSRLLAQFASELTPVVVFDMAEFVNLLNLNRDRDLFVNALMTLAEDFQRRKTIGEYTFSKGRVAVH
jgi:hypothetical protein